MKFRTWIPGRAGVSLFLVLLAWGEEMSFAGTDIYRNARHHVRVEEISPPCPSLRHHGYLEVRFRVDNFSTNKAHRVSIRVPSRNHNMNEHAIRMVSATAEIEGQSSRTISLWIPPIGLHGPQEAIVSIDGVAQRPLALDTSINGYSPIAGLRSHYYSHGHGSDVLYRVLLTPRLKHREMQSAIEKQDSYTARPGVMSHGGNVKPEVLKHPAGLADWSDNWLAYSQYDGIIAAREDLQAMSEPVRSAIFRWVECGGTLTVIGDAALPESWEGNGTSFSPGFGYVMRVQGSMESMEPGVIRALLSRHWKRSFEIFSGQPVVSDANDLLQLVDEKNLPVRALFFLMLLFAFIIGPLNLYLLHKWNRRIWLLWTVPLISAVTCLLVFVFSLFSEGIRATECGRSFTFLDEGSKRAVSFGYTGVYSPLTPSGGLRFGMDTAALPLFGTRVGNLKDVRCGGDQHFSRGWIAARVPAIFKLWRNSSSQVRLKIEKMGANDMTVINGFGEDIQAVIAAGPDGKLYRGGAMDAGARVTLTHDASLQLKGGVGTWKRARFHPIGLLQTDWINKAPEVLNPNEYLLVLKGDPFLDRPLPRARTKHRRAVVHGRFAVDGT